MRLSNIALAISVAYGAFNPASLFANGEQGAWYDPSDLTTLFQDSAGTTPVTGVEQFVGLMLDKSKGLVLGPELVTPAANRDFSSDTGYWTKTAGVTITGGQCVFTAVNTAFGFYRSSFATAGTYYEVTFTLTSVTAGGFRVYIGGNRGATVTAAGTYTQRIQTGSIDTDLYFEAANGPATLTLDDVSVKIVTGNHAFQTQDAKRPKLAARYNLLTYTEQFDNGAWDVAGLTRAANQTTAPDGTTTADRITGSSGTNAVIFPSTAYVALASNLTVSCYIKAGTADYAVLSLWAGGGTTGVNLWVNVQTGAIGSSAATAGYTFASGSSTAVGNGWYRVVLAGTVPAGNVYFSLRLVDSDNAFVYTNTVGKTLFIWGADLRPASQATGLIGPTYQRVVDAATYDTAGFLPYLEFNGLTWSMSTGNIDPGTDKVQVFAGVRKLSDAAVAILCESSAGSSVNPGTFYITAPETTGANGDFRFKSRGSLDTTPLTSGAYTAPTTRVLSGIGDIAADTAILRINGAQVANTTSDQGTGNYGNYPLFMGARNNASLYFNGWLTSLIVRFGATLTQSQIEATEAWVNQRTGAY